MNAFSESLGAITSAFEELQIPYLIGGSLASSARGVLRATLDVDVLASIQAVQAGAFATALGADWYVDPEIIRSCIQAGRAFNVIHRPSGQKVDIFPARSEFHRSELERATQVRLDESEARFPVATAEDILVAKLEWYQAGGGISERQWSDVIGVLKANPNLDLVYARRWAERLGVSGLLERAVQQAR